MMLGNMRDLGVQRLIAIASQQSLTGKQWR
jgi:hypothetical protein